MPSELSNVEAAPQPAAGFFKPGWAKIKLLCVLLSVLSGAFSNHDDWSTNSAPAWIIPLAALWMFGMTALHRFRMPRRKWIEREFWATNPFRNLFSFRDKAAGVFFLHFVALNGIAGGVGALSRATFQIEDGRTFYGLLSLAVGASTWIGARLRDLVNEMKLI